MKKTAPVIDNWKQFKHKYERSINSKKALLNITLYDSYYPAHEKLLLRDLKKLLIDNGYHNTILVKDKQFPGYDPLEISQQCMLFSQINLLIFTIKGKRHGVIDELAFITSDPRMRERVQFSMVLYQVSGKRSSIPDLSRSRVKIFGIQNRQFKTFKQLKQIIVKETYWLMRKWFTYRGPT